MLDLTKKEQLMKLVTQIVPSQMKHHAEAEACDLLMEVERLDILKEFVDQVRKLLLYFITFIKSQTLLTTS